jgi:hypothetical protein
MMSPRRFHATNAVAFTTAMVIGLVLAVVGLASAGSDTAPTATCERGDTATVCTVPHEQVTSTVTETVTQPPVTETVTETVTVTPSPTVTEPPAAAQKVVGMSAVSSTWSQRLSEVGATGITARRIFADLTSTGRDQSTLIQQALDAGMMPVLSYKVPSVSTLNSNGYDSWLANLNTYLGNLDGPVTATFWHEPHGDMSPADFRAGSQQFLDSLTDPDISVGPILNGWLLDNRVADWASYTSPALLAQWDFLGLDSYQEGTVANPSTTLLPGRAIPKAATWLDDQGFPDKRILVGEYNGQTVQGMEYAHQQILSTPELWVACVWNMDHMQNGSLKFNVLSGSRLTEFREFKADARILK